MLDTTKLQSSLIAGWLSMTENNATSLAFPIGKVWAKCRKLKYFQNPPEKNVWYSNQRQAKHVYKLSGYQY